MQYCKIVESLYIIKVIHYKKKWKRVKQNSDSIILSMFLVILYDFSIPSYQMKHCTSFDTVLMLGLYSRVQNIIFYYVNNRNKEGNQMTRTHDVSMALKEVWIRKEKMVLYLCANQKI